MPRVEPQPLGLPLDFTCPALLANTPDHIETNVAYEARWYALGDRVQILGAWDEDGLWCLDRVEPYDLHRAAATARHWAHQQIEDMP